MVYLGEPIPIHKRMQLLQMQAQSVHTKAMELLVDFWHTLYTHPGGPHALMKELDAGAGEWIKAMDVLATFINYANRCGPQANVRILPLVRPLPPGWSYTINPSGTVTLKEATTPPPA